MEKSDSMESSHLWFSHREYRYDAELKGNQHVFHWSDNSEIWDWDNCTVSALNRPDDKIRIVIRSTNAIQSKYRKGYVELKYMLGFDVTNVHQPKTEDYHEPPKDNVKNKVYGPPRQRWVVQLGEDYWIWEWAEQGRAIESSAVYQIYEMIKKKLDAPDFSKSSIFNIVAHDDGRIIPTIYQPAIDSWKNFVREVHCHKINDDEIEVTILFNNEQLREHAIVNPLYEWIRSLIYRRVIDVETFRIILKDGVPVCFKFDGIYSEENDIQEDDIHKDKPDIHGNVPPHEIKYYFANMRHPIVFVNTANHAMAEHDTNHRLWKWEYIPWEKGSTVVYGEKSRKQIDKSFLTSTDVTKSLRWFQKYQFIILLAVGYGVWFSFLDVIPTIGKVFGNYYQLWNYIGHPLPSLFWLFIAPKKWEFWAAAFLISTAVMDSPLWGAIREVQGYNFWCEPVEPFKYREDCTFGEWLAFYYNPIGNYTILGRESTLTFFGIFIPTAWIIFISLPARFGVAYLLILRQYEEEKRRILGR